MITTTLPEAESFIIYTERFPAGSHPSPKKNCRRSRVQVEQPSGSHPVSAEVSQEGLISRQQDTMPRGAFRSAYRHDPIRK